jgi:hypothetical protein
MFQLNPLNIFGLRQLNHCPPHFFSVDFDLATTDKKISDWIYENLAGRFFLGDVLVTNERGQHIRKRAGFEVHGEATLFALQLSEINKF